RTITAVGHREVERTAEHAAVRVVVAQVGGTAAEVLDAAIGMLDGPLEAPLLVAEGARLAQLVMDRVPRPVGAFQQHRRPREAKPDAGDEPARFDVARRLPDVVAHTPRVI